jgi:hypothetical protein
VRYEPAQVCSQAPPKNLVIEWQASCAQVVQVCKNLGVENADPQEYRNRYGHELKQPCEVPSLCPCIKPPQQDCGCEQELVGDVHALRLVDLERNGLGNYRKYVQ